ncbi:sulfatase-like hydrolase/transferase [bacterium]|nr:sulfatase-like hydrolase/transferase [bacterium]
MRSFHARSALNGSEDRFTGNATSLGPWFHACAGGVLALHLKDLQLTYCSQRTPIQESFLLAQAKPNIIILVLDALRARNLGCYGMPGNPSPNIDAVAKRGVVFEDTYSSFNTTDQSLTSIMSGRYPRHNGMMNHGDKVSKEEWERLNRTDTRLTAEVLKEAGYDTIAVDWMGRWHKRGYDNYGYEIDRAAVGRLKYYSFDLPKQYIEYMVGHLPILELYAPQRKSEKGDLVKGLKDVWSTFMFSRRLAQLQDAGFVTDVARERIRNRSDNPFFLFLHYWDTHTPYHCPNSYLKRYNPGKDHNSYLTAKYMGSISYTDYHVGRLFSTLHKEGLLNDTLVVITSDHGDSLTEHGIYFDHHGLYKETTHCPMVLHYPNRFPQGKRIPGFVQHIDLLPTFCELLGIEMPESQFDGHSLLGSITGDRPVERDHVFIEESYVQKKAALRTDTYTYIKATDGEGWCNYCQKVHVGTEELYDLENDPGEENDVTSERPEVAAELRERLDHTIAELDAKREAELASTGDDGGEDVELSAEEEEILKKRLKDLGYM